ncbi:MAG TPA: hypothetical protein VI815_03810 [Candidatus Nanoarchaeia archaeon]|nr:hypothetical protein [Candidatus Nanoarchaeia archaeon]
MVRDKRFAIAILIILILLAVLAYVLLIGPGIQGYVINKQINAQETVVKAVIDIVEQQGFVSLTDGNRSVILVKYVAPQNASV